ncbi:hypothetical protein [Rossellomorea vietnamensis]|uniref:hypothetical protein n=1 Tax=Rossellomorea vietnamensis TaxID=218284 RepID=UPI0007617BB1|nr:hypothetical protein [Rossellomorea vietnamensis]
MSDTFHTMPVLIRNTQDLDMFHKCIESLSRSEEDPFVVLYNQGVISNTELYLEAEKYLERFHILGEGKNDGIPFARQGCFEYIWEYHPECAFITEIHADMVFQPGWTTVLKGFLKNNPNEPCVCPGILTANGEWHPHEKGISRLDIPGSMNELLVILKEYRQSRVVEGFVHPVMHNSAALRNVGGYNLSDLAGKQGYEDDYLLLSYFNLLHLPEEWKPKADLNTCVYHQTMAQRMDFTDMNEEAEKNFRGLVSRFGSKGLLDLKRIHQGEDTKEDWNLVFFGGLMDTPTSDAFILDGYNSYIITRNGYKGEEEGITFLPYSKLEQVRPDRSIAVVSHPFWVTVIAKWNPEMIITLHPHQELMSENRDLEFYSSALYLKSSAIITDSEEHYFNLSLKYPFVYFISHSTSDKSADSAIYNPKEETLIELIQALRFQQEEYYSFALQLNSKLRASRIDHLKNSLKWDPHNEFLLACLGKYLYLQREYSLSEDYFFQAFSRNVVVFNDNQGLKKYYPWICLAQARQGKVGEVLNSYGILALSPELKNHYHHLLGLYHREQAHIVLAEVSKVYGDIPYAEYLYQNSEEQWRSAGLFQLYKERMNHEPVLKILNENKDVPSLRKEWWLISGEMAELSGDVNHAKHCYLQASCYDESQLDRILRMEALDEFLKCIVQGGIS